MQKDPKKKKVVIAMSGGVDSSVAAALLKDQGYDVVGITMQIWVPEQTEDEVERFGGCCSLSSVEDARSVAQKLDIPYYVLNFREIFNEKVVNNFLSEYEKGRTPNPCVRCNQFIKFEALFQKAKALDADYLATGHYARITKDEKTGRFNLLKAKDAKKDQTYFLYMLTQQQLASSLFPLADYEKSEIRHIAENIGLRVANKPESQEICFIPDNDYRKFLKEKIINTIEEGTIFNSEKEKVGKHKGIVHYTIGQRKGLNVHSEVPLYVTEINSEDNSITVGDKSKISGMGLYADEVNFISIEKLEGEMKVKAQIRYNSEPTDAVINSEGDKIKVVFDNPQEAISPGQAVVFYDGEKVVGGATIESQIRN